MTIQFWLKTWVIRFPFFDSSQWRAWRRQWNPHYVHERDRHPVREKHHGKGGWKSRSDSGIVYRDYSDYQEYLNHQESKWDEVLKIKGGLSRKELINYRIKFYNRFKFLLGHLDTNAKILCLGARQGTEVEVLRDLGFLNAYGIDLNPGPENPFVKKGDFMHLEESDGSLDMIYTNCVDHAFNLDAFFQEHARVLKEDGLALYDLPLGQGPSPMGGPFESVSWDSDGVVFEKFFKYFRSLLKVETEPGWMWVLLKGTHAGKEDSMTIEK
ncbi:MAG: methyltransferase domain-containing protein [Magnetococcales bacterium]|nr:methyltransferase domain-containing protein [Magnetococcales bacterium]